MQCIDNVFPSSVSIRWLRFPWRPVSSTLHVPSAWAPETPTAAGVSCTTCEFCLPPLPLPLLAAEGLKPRDLGSPKTACRKLPTCQSPVRACVRDWLALTWLSGARCFQQLLGPNSGWSLDSRIPLTQHWWGDGGSPESSRSYGCSLPDGRCPSEGLTCDSQQVCELHLQTLREHFGFDRARSISSHLNNATPRLACITLRHTQQRGSGRLKILCLSASCRVFEADLGRGLASVPSYDVCLPSRQ